MEWHNSWVNDTWSTMCKTMQCEPKCQMLDCDLHNHSKWNHSHAQNYAVHFNNVWQNLSVHKQCESKMEES